MVVNINIADTDTLMYEVRYNEYIKDNHGFAFIPKQKNVFKPNKNSLN